MTMEQKLISNRAFVRNVQNNDIYEYLCDDTYKNLRTQQQGKVPPETAQKIFKINLEATIMINENPLIEKLIHTLNLKIDKNE